MKKKIMWSLLLAAASMQPMWGADYGLPAEIQQGNILHCFNWTMAEVKAELPAIAAAGFGSVQLSPLQRPDIQAGYAWHDLYRPFDLKFAPSQGMGSADDLRALCAEADTYGIKVIVDVVANHVDKTAGYHDTWWDANGRVRWEGGINYGNRYSITHGQLGDYGDVNSEDPEVIAKGKAYVEALRDMGVKGIRWDAAKHIGLPSEGCGFWSAVTSVPGIWHYGEILDAPGPDASLIKEYTSMMSVTDNRYCNPAARNNGGIPSGYGGDWAVSQQIPDTRLVYWGESHDTYSNDEWSQNVAQEVIDRAYAAMACRNGATALYLARPSTKGFSNIKIGKGTDAFKGKAVAEVNKFRNVMTGRADYFTGAGNACSITRENGGAVIVARSSGNVSIANGGSYCPAGTYTDRVSGATFTVTSTTISGNVGASGIAVIYNDGTEPEPGPGPDPDPTPAGDLYVLGNLEGTAGWGATPGTGVKLTVTDGKYSAKNVKFVLADGETKCYFSLTDFVGSSWDALNASANRYGAANEGDAITVGTPAAITKYANGVNASACKAWTIAPGTYDISVDLAAMTIILTQAGTEPEPGPDPDPTPAGDLYVLGNLEGTAGWGSTPGTGVKLTVTDGKYSAKNVKFVLADGETKCYFSLTDFVGSTWDALNTSANRYGAANEGDAITVGTPAKITKYANGVNASACKAWAIAPGTYDISVDLAAMTIILTQAGTEPEPGPDPDKDVYVYYEGPWSPTIYVYNNDNDSMTSWDEAPAMLLYEAPATLSRAADDKYYYYKLPEAYRSAYVIFKNGDEQYPAAQQPGLKMEGKSRIFRHDTKTWEEFDGPTSAIGQIAGDRQDATISCSGRTLSVTGLTGGFVLVAGIDGRICYSANAAADFSLDLAPGVYIVRTNSQTTRVAVR